MAPATWRYALPLLLLIVAIAALMAGGVYIWLALAAILILGVPLDEAIGDERRHLSPRARVWFVANLALALPLLTILTVVLLYRFTAGDPLGLEALLGIEIGGGDDFFLTQLVSIIVAAELYASAGVAAGHELVHWTASKWAVAVGRMLLAFTLDTGYAISHVYGHHRTVGLYRDPATARRDESVYAFFLRTNVGQIGEAFRLEADRLRRRDVPVLSWQNRAIRGQFFTLAIVVAAGLIAGWPGVAAFLAAAILGRFAHQSITYYQHYGLVRAEATPIAPRHSWDGARLVSNATLHNVPHHAEHHLAGGKRSWELRATGTASPNLPLGYRGMFLLSLMPRRYRKAVNPILREWDRSFATDAERELIRQRGWEIPENFDWRARRPRARTAI